MADLSFLTPESIAGFLLDPSRIAPSIYITIEHMEEMLGGLEGRTKRILAFSLSFLAPVAGILIRVWEGVQSFGPELVVTAVVGVANVLLATRIHDLIDGRGQPNPSEAGLGAQPPAPTPTYPVVPQAPRVILPAPPTQNTSIGTGNSQ